MVSIQTAQEAIKNIKDGMSIMVGGFLGVGSPLNMLEELASSGVENLTLIQPVASYPGGNHDVGKLTANRQVKKFIGAHIGTDPEIGKQYNEGTLEVEFNPMGTLAERIRAGGAGLGAIVTPTGLGTEIEEGREKIVIDGKEYLLYPPLKADVALIKGFRADKAGNIEYRGTSKGINPIMATAANIVIAEVDEIVEIGEIPYDNVGTPGIFVDIVVQGNTLEERQQYFEDLWIKAKKIV
ncbi:MAG: CoA transferase subunit A [Clostridium sp.]|nr:CoA transferase subunit A [Clostridium sp.]